jgi:TRAP-type C4-dicarboxylate transport system permease small subunit
MAPSPPRALYRRLSAGFGRLLSRMVAVSVGILVLPVSLQMASRWIEALPHYIWTEEMARLLFIWMIMLGAMLGVRESTHFEVDLWPRLGPRLTALLGLVSALCVLVFALVFVWWGIEFTQFAFGRISELAELPLWTIHVAWPVAGLAWTLFLGERIHDQLMVLAGRVPIE